MSNVFDHLHLKRSSKGSPNELSFDVLDAASSSAPPKHDSATFSPSPLRKQGNYEGVANTTTALTNAAIERRKRARRVRKMRLWILVVVAVAAIAGALGYSGFNYYKDKQDFATRFDALVEQLTEADSSVAGIDAVMADPFGTDVKEREKATEAIPKALEVIDSLKASVRDARSYTMNDQDASALEEVAASAVTREAMITTAGQAFSLAGDVDSATEAIELIWTKVLNADKLARKATEAANEATTEEALGKSRDDSQQALESMQGALQELEDYAKSRSVLDLSAYTAYLKTRVSALEHAVATDDALLAMEEKRAQSENDAYTKADGKAASQAKKLPDSVRAAVEASYAPDLSKLGQDYRDNREKVIGTDSQIRDYLRRIKR